MNFNVFIDESGEAGIAKVRDGNSPGASPYFVLGAMVVQKAGRIAAEKQLAEIKQRIGKDTWKHATDLSHNEKVFFARSIANTQARYFAIISNKLTLREYKDFIDANPQKYYNKCLKYLLEKICLYLSHFEAREEQVSVVLEERNHDYDAMLRYLQRVRDNPLHINSRSLRLLNPFSITRKPKGSDPCLEYADFVAHAVFQLTNKSLQNFSIPEPRYFVELSKRFAGDANGRVLDTGLKCIHRVDDIQFDRDIEAIVARTRVEPPRNP